MENVEYNQGDFLKYGDMFALKDNSYYYDNNDSIQKNFMDNINEIYKSNRSWRNFEYLLKERKIKIVKKPSESRFGWFWGEKSTTGDDLLYTFDRYKEIFKDRSVGENLSRKEQTIRMEERRKDQERIFNFIEKKPKTPVLQPPKLMEKRIQFKSNFPEIIEIYLDFMMENDYKLNYFLDNNLESYTEVELNDLMIKKAQKKYNFEKDQYNENVKNYSRLSFGMKEKTKEMEENLDKFLLKLKPLIRNYKSKKSARDESFKTQILKAEKTWQEKLEEQDDILEKKQKGRQAQIDQEKRKQIEVENEGGRVFNEEIRRMEELQARQRELEVKKTNEEIENLEYKIRDAQSKYSMNKSKFNKLYFKLKNVNVLEKRKSILEEKIKNTNLKIEERQNLLKQKTEIEQKLKNVDSLKNQLADLKSKIPDLSVYEQEKILRENELEKLKKLNETSIREKNAKIRSLELEKMKQEITIREEQRYQQEKRQAEELKQLKLVFLKERKLSQKRIDQLKWESKSKKIKMQNILENESELREQKQKLAEILAQKQSALKSKQAEIERKKIQTLEIEKQKLQQKQDLAEQQKLFQDSIQRDIDELNLQKQLLSETTNANKKILSNTKREISQRQTEIEKTISLNMENAKKSANEIYAKEAKIKLDVFQTLSDVKEQAAIQSELEIELENKKQEILRKEAVSSLLSDTIDSIEKNEISEIENYNSFLESEIDFKKKLSDTHLTQKQVLEILTDEKKTYIQFLEETKSSYLTQMLNAKRDILETNMKIILTEGKENLSYVTSGMKSEIENLEKRKEINQRKKDLAQFQSDNLKKELNLRNQEIELLKNIRLKVLETERRVIRNEARQAFLDFAKAEEKKTRDADVREKLDEIIDDVESKDISQKTKATLFSLIDKIENQEIHDAAKQKLDFILDKIELHDNIDESRKALDKILDSIEDSQIQKEVETKLDEILDDVEYDDIDFLDEEDELESFLSSVRKHISGEQKMDRFSTILQETREMDSKLKMEENIEMRERNERPPEQDEIGETSFDEFSDYNFFINNIEDPILKEKTRTFLGNIDAFEKEEEKIPKIKNAYKSAINSALWEDKLDTDYWDGNIILDENAKFLYEQKLNNVNTALVDYNLHLDPTDMKIREFLEIKLTESKSEKRGEINGYIYNGEKIISRNISRNFYFNYLKKPAACQSFIDALKDKINNTARSQIASESFFENKAVKDCALEYIGELREEQSYQIDSARNATEMRNALREANDIDNEIKNIKKNISFKMRLKIFRRTLSWRFTKLLRFLWKHKGKTTTLVGGLII